MAETGSAIIQSGTLIRNMTEMLQAIEDEGKALRSGKLGDAATQAFVDAERARVVVQREIDATVLKNMQNLGSTMEFLNQMTLAMVKQQESISKLLDKLKEMPQTAADFNKSVGSIVDNIFRGMGIPLPAPDSPSRASSTLSALREFFGGGQSLPVSVVPGQQPIPVTIVSNSPSAIPVSPATPAGTAVSQAPVVSDMAVTRLASSIENDSTNLVADITRLQTQIASLTSANNNNEQMIAVLTDQNGLMETLNDKMGEMIDSNRNIFNALA
jgi:hypothetical protein